MPEDIQALYKQAIAFHDDQKWDQAIEAFSRVLSLIKGTSLGTPRVMASIYNRRGVAYNMKDDYDRAIEDFDEALKLRPDYADAYLYRGLAYSNKDDYGRAIKDFTEALKLQPSHANAYLSRGLAYSDKGDHDRAIKDFDEVLKLRPNHADACHDRGLAYLRKGDHDRAIKDFDKALELQPNHADACHNRGVAYLEKGDHDRAIKDFDEALKLRPNHADAYLGRGLAYSSMSDYDRAIKDFDEVLKLRPNYVEAYFSRGAAYINKDDYDRAIKDFDEVLKLWPDYAVAYNNRGVAYSRKDDYGRAMEDFGKANKYDPNLISISPFCYITSKASSKAVCPKLLKLYSDVYEIKRRLVYKPSENPYPIAHYTDLNSLKKLAQKSPFRFYNATYMSDPEEGKTLLEKLGLPDKDDKTKDFLSGSEHSPAYVGSFVKTSKEPEDEKLFLWRTYGKHGGQEAGGACLHFDISQFSDRPPEQLGGMHSLSLRAGKEEAGRSLEQLKGMHSAGSKDFSSAFPTPQKECIYEIAHKSDIESKGLLSPLKKLATMLDEIRGQQGWNEQNLDHQLAREILDEIRFLFKADHYQEEKELRIVKIRYSSGEQTKDVKVDNDTFPPRFYMEAPLQLQLKKIILGPQARGFLEWKQWIKTNDDLEVKQSSVKYGSGYS